MLARVLLGDAMLSRVKLPGSKLTASVDGTLIQKQPLMVDTESPMQQYQIKNV